MNSLYPAVAERAGRRCEYCRAPEEIYNFTFEVEHILPPARGGTNTLENLALSCNACNRFKSDAITGYDAETTQEIPLFNPRQQHWQEHFSLDEKTLEILGVTSTGRATVTRLRMNLAHQVKARRYWIELRLFP